MITSTAARIELLVCKANARSLYLRTLCPSLLIYKSAVLLSFTGLPNDLSPEGPVAVGVAHRIRRAVLATAAGRVG